MLILMLVNWARRRMPDFRCRQVKFGRREVSISCFSGLFEAHETPGGIGLDVLLHNVVSGAQREVPKYSDKTPPEPAFVLRLSNEVYNGASFFAIQKALKDEFSFDVYYDAPGVESKLDCEKQLFEVRTLGARNLLSLSQRRVLQLVYAHSKAYLTIASGEAFHLPKM